MTPELYARRYGDLSKNLAVVRAYGGPETDDLAVVASFILDELTQHRFMEIVIDNGLITTKLDGAEYQQRCDFNHFEVAVLALFCMLPLSRNSKARKGAL